MFVTVVFFPVLVPPTSWLGNEMLPGVTVIAEATPVPTRLSVCGLLLASSTIVSVPARVPVVLGVKVT
jgi:hypothetical protein